MNRQSENRARLGLFVILALGVALLVLIATRPGPETDDDGVVLKSNENAVATVNGQPVFQRDIDQWLMHNDLAPDESSRQQAIDALIERQLLASSAKSENLDRRPDIQAQIRQARNKILANAYINLHIQKTVNDDALQSLYTAQADLRRGGIQRRARQILVPDEATANEVIGKLDRGDSFQSLALAYSLDRASRETGGDMGFFSRDSFPAEFSSPVFSAGMNGRLAPFETNRGWHIVEITGQRQTPSPSFEDIKDELREYLTARSVNDLMEDLKSGAEIEYINPKEPENKDLTDE